MPFVSRPNERDRSIERLLKESFRKPEAGVTDSCLDAETLAAFSDGGLAGEALELAQTHLADCARCQGIIGAAIRVRTIARDPEPVRAGRRWLAWAIPLTAGAAALAIWVAVPRPATTPAQLHAPNEAPQTKVAEPPAAAPQVQPSPEVTQQQQDSAARKNDQPPRDAPSTSLQKDGDLKELDRLKQETRSDRGALADQSAAAPPAPAAPPVAAAPPARREAFERATNSAEKLGASAVTSLATTAGTTRWRIAGTALERSQDSGTTWTAVATGTNALLTAVSAASPTVCWVVGRAGVVLRTTDGQSLSRVPFPEMTDLTAVQARSAQSATVTTADGRVFATTDAGGTWQRR